jgi:UDP-glucose 4-epimerase
VGVTVAVTGPTGEIGISAVTALEQSPAVDRIVGMARRPFDPSAAGWTKTSYRPGDIVDRQAVEDLVADADVVIHLAFIIFGSREESARVPLTEDVPPHGSPEHYYSEQKAACEALLAEITKGSSLEVFILRPCIVAGPKASALAAAMPWRHLPGVVQSAPRAVPLLKMPAPTRDFRCSWCTMTTSPPRSR